VAWDTCGAPSYDCCPDPCGGRKHHGLFHRLKGWKGSCGAAASCCDAQPSCGCGAVTEPTCGCEMVSQPSCGCEPGCGYEPSCGCGDRNGHKGLLHKLFGHKRRGGCGGCCEVAEPTCGCEPSCGF
jgi:hypothetical protein